MNNQSLIRDFKLGCLRGDCNITIDTSLLPSKWFYFLNKKRKTILKLFNRGAVLTGSRALYMTKINDSKIDLINTPRSEQPKHQSDLNNIMINIYS